MRTIEHTSTARMKNKGEKMKYNIWARRTDAPTADGYGDWDIVGHWDDIDLAEDAIYFWMDEQKFELSGFEQTGSTSYRFNGHTYDVMAEKA